MTKLECRWCKRWITDVVLYPNKRGAHEERCAKETLDWFDKITSKAAYEYSKHQLAWSIELAKRWRTLPGKGWAALDKYPMVEYLGTLKKGVG